MYSWTAGPNIVLAPILHITVRCANRVATKGRAILHWAHIQYYTVKIHVHAWPRRDVKSIVTIEGRLHGQAQCGCRDQAFQCRATPSRLALRRPIVHCGMTRHRVTAATEVERSLAHPAGDPSLAHGLQPGQRHRHYTASPPSS